MLVRVDTHLRQEAAEDGRAHRRPASGRVHGGELDVLPLGLVAPGPALRAYTRAERSFCIIACSFIIAAIRI